MYDDDLGSGAMDWPGNPPQKVNPTLPKLKTFRKLVPILNIWRKPIFFILINFEEIKDQVRVCIKTLSSPWLWQFRAWRLCASKKYENIFKTPFFQLEKPRFLPKIETKDNFMQQSESAKGLSKFGKFGKFGPAPDPKLKFCYFCPI